MEWHWPDDAEVRDGLPGYKPTTKGHPRKIREAAELILRSERPVIYAGGGILKARAAEALRELAELCDIHVVTTLMARGAFPDGHPLCLGMPGMHGNYTAVTSMQRSDLLIALGQPLRRPGHRQGRRVRARRQDHPRRHRPRRARQGPPARRPDRRRLPPRDRGAGVGHQGPARRRRGLPDRSPWKRTISGWQETLPAHLRPVRARRRAQAAVRARAAPRQHARRLHRRLGRRPAPDVDVAVLEVRPPLHLGELGRPRHDGLRGAGRHRRQGRPARRHGVGRRRRRLLPDDGPGARHRGRRAHPGEDRHPQQRLPRHGPPVAGDVLRGALLRGVPVARPARLQALGRGHGLRRHAGRLARGGGVGHPEGQRDRRPPGGHRLPHRLARRRCSRWSPPAPATTTSSPTPPSGRTSSSEPTTTTSSTTSSPSWWRTRPACWPGSSGLFARRGFNIISLAVAPTEDERFSRITIVGRRRVGAARAGHQAAVQADQRREDHRAGPARRRRAGADAGHGRRARGHPQPDHRAGRRVRGPDPRTSATSASPCPSTAPPTSSTTSPSCSAPTASPSSSAPAGSPCRSSTTPPRDASARPDHRLVPTTLRRGTWCPLLYDGSED